MTIKTLEYIHRLLIQAKAETKKAYNAARDLQHQYEETGDPRMAAQEEVAEALMHRHFEAHNALEDFESCEW
ncbi:MAG: hypothetical protein LUB63_01310 [Oscillospiraceae bacterium]|nr:hypothetical protein [Oscillospiraceae bacterium]